MLRPRVSLRRKQTIALSQLISCVSLIPKSAEPFAVLTRRNPWEDSRSPLSIRIY
jgi:hypothetical protein